MQELIYGNEIFNLSEAKRMRERAYKRAKEKRQREEKINNIGTCGLITLMYLSPLLMFVWWLMFGYL